MLHNGGQWGPLPLSLSLYVLRQTRMCLHGNGLVALHQIRSGRRSLRHRWRVDYARQFAVVNESLGWQGRSQLSPAAALLILIIALHLFQNYQKLKQLNNTNKQYIWDDLKI